jgi:DNA (cytosine-5)-methyltransferase 1
LKTFVDGCWDTLLEQVEAKRSRDEEKVKEAGADIWRLKVGHDCAGMDAAGHALRNLLGQHVEHTFSSDIDKFCCLTLKANFPPTVPYFGEPAGDITKRSHDKVPECQLYFAGFPCQSFSRQGKRKGTEDPRGQVFDDGVLPYLRQHEPPAAILENVEGLLSWNKGAFFKHLLEALQGLGCYRVEYKVLNTKDHGLPHSRPRLYIVLLHLRKASHVQFTWPEPIRCPPVEHFLDGDKPKLQPQDIKGPARPKLARKEVAIVNQMHEKLMGMLTEKGLQPHEQTYLIDLEDKRGCVSMRQLCPCMCKAGHQVWISSYDRELSISERMRLQGIHPDEFVRADGVSDCQLRQQLGNTISVNVLERLLVRMKGLVPFDLRDRWEDGLAQEALRGKAHSDVAVESRKQPQPKRSMEEEKEDEEKEEVQDLPGGKTGMEASSSAQPTPPRRHKKRSATELTEENAKLQEDLKEEKVKRLRAEDRASKLEDELERLRAELAGKSD